MKSKKAIGIPIAMLLCLCFVINSYAGSITFMYVYPDTDYGSGATATAYVNTDADILYVKWCVNGADERWTMHEKGTRFVFKEFTLTGNIKGSKYEIEAEVWFWDDDVLDTDSYTFRMYKPKIIGGKKQPTWEKPDVTGVYGEVQLYRHYHDGQNIVVDGSVYAHNRTDEICHVTSWFRHTEYGEDGFPTGWQKQEPPLDVPNPGRPLSPGKVYSDYGSSSISYHVGGPIRQQQRIMLNAHIHLEVSGNGTTDVWHDNSWTHTFYHSDNQ